jgi:hypothetical protein
MNKVKILIFSLFLTILFSCHENKAISTSTGIIEQKGFILTSELIDNGYFNNRLFYFFTSEEVDSKYHGLKFVKSLDSTGLGFSLYSSYYIRLINSMGIDLISYAIDNAKTDPYKLKIEYWKVIPVNVSLMYNPNLKNNSDILIDSILVEDGSYVNFKYKYIGAAKITQLEILLPKDDDLTGNESMFPIRKFGIFGKGK